MQYVCDQCLSRPQEIEFMYKPGNVSAAPPVVTPHQPRLDWQMWFAALAPQAHSPWFTGFVYRLLQGKKEGERRERVRERPFPTFPRILILGATYYSFSLPSRTRTLKPLPFFKY